MNERALLDSVLADFDDDAPRLIYADWLDEQGRSDRAELIRVQVELDRLPVLRRRYHDRAPRSVVRRVELLDREEILLNRTPADMTMTPNNFTWMGPATFEMTVMGKSSPEDTARHLAWRRGFICRVGCHGDDLLDYMDQAATENPIEEVVLTSWPSTPEGVSSLGFDVIGRRVRNKRWPKVRRWTFPPAPDENAVVRFLDSIYRWDLPLAMENRRVVIGRTAF